MGGAMTTMHNMGLPPELMDEILDYITATQGSLSAQDEFEKFEKFISPTLQKQVSVCIFLPIISSNYVFKKK
jgi:hypothetical protein